MRLDKYLKVSHLIKRRTIAKEAAESKRININSRAAKPSSEVKEGDILEIRYASKVLKIKVLCTNEYTKKDETESMYEVLPNE
ncbi:MAG: RNA-binding S4 domain-containing protein [Bacillales bacterium]|nr:RNA-binding S4 domain-containing protein [Bacillales bacterium]